MNGTLRPHSLVSVVIPAYNAARHIGEQLASLTRQDYEGPFEVVVADNGSKDDTVGVAKSFAGSLDLHVIDASAMRGAGPVRNAAVEVTRGELLVFADADDVASVGWLRHLVAAAPQWDLTGGPYDLHLLNPPVVQAWRQPLPKDRFPVGHAFLPFAMSGNLAVLKETFKHIGGFRDGQQEDVDFSWRAQLSGYTLGFAREAVIHYRQRSTVRRHAIQAMSRGHASVRLYRDFRNQGMPRTPAWIRLLGMTTCLSRAPRSLVDSQKRGYWAGDFAYRVGNIGGSIRYRVLFL